MRFEGKVALVSGGGSLGESMSNGRAACMKFAREGAKVAVVDHNLASAEVTVSMIEAEGGEAIAIEADVTVEADVRRMVEKTISTYDKVDVLFNNVGAGWGTDIMNTSEELWDNTFNVCLKSVFLVSKHVVAEMRKTGGGAIVNNSSAAAIAHDSIWAYNCAKAGVIKLTKDMAYDYGSDNIRVNCVVPGPVDSAAARLRRGGDDATEEHRNNLKKVMERLIPLHRSGTPEEIANAVIFLASDEASFCNGTCLVVDGGLSLGMSPNVLI